MRRGSLLFLSVILLGAKQQPAHYPLPKSADITIGQPQWKQGDIDADSCRQYHLTPEQIRKQFRTYRLLSPGDVHDSYTVFQCWINGTVKVAGKTFTWESRPGNLMETNWPDGAKKMLGGKPSGELKD
ncbi:hypothetical protein [Edaphobacter modestus]|uniref:Uncharacterized protein n=1 Tax=Edaphobacter modestus TaxID=388466 RepID=A0A4Q7YSZ4_9BACT|nr:hypothetical protein [Edaphobacter modestus]RZU40039.1 hypothetical protein BDD14_1458 [Edaphobacter modestus]